jgi:Arc-like DNA binding domain
MKRKKRIGRPPKAEADRKATHFTFRTRGGLRELLLTAAAASGRSVSEEIERRLEASFRSDEILEGLRAIREAIGLPRDEILETLRAMREAIGLADLPPDTSVSSLTADHLDLYEIRRKREQQRAGQPVSKLTDEKKNVS